MFEGKSCSHFKAFTKHLSHLRQVNHLLAIIAVMDGQSFAQVA